MARLSPTDAEILNASLDMQRRGISVPEIINAAAGLNARDNDGVIVPLRLRHRSG